nr:4-hydroxythreonine-4-phosphate dehydrogenase PdxA [Saprospiraceae bacterium]
MIKIGITIGDINGIGPEVIIKALSNTKLLEYFTPIVYGSYKVLSYHKNIVANNNMVFHSIQHPGQAVEGKINLINCWEDNVAITLGRPTEEGGKYAMLALEKAGKDIVEKQIDAVVTAPINKHAMQLAKFPYPGHTEFFTYLDNNSKSLMLMQSEDLKIALATNHLPLSQVAAAISKELVIEKIMTLNKTMIEDFGFEKPLIGVLGMNPHASDNGLMGNEEAMF